MAGEAAQGAAAGGAVKHVHVKPIWSQWKVLSGNQSAPRDRRGSGMLMSTFAFGGLPEVRFPRCSSFCGPLSLFLSLRVLVSPCFAQCVLLLVLSDHATHGLTLICFLSRPAHTTTRRLVRQ